MPPRTSVAPRPAASSSSRRESSKRMGGRGRAPHSLPPLFTSRASIRAGYKVGVILLVERHGHLNRVPEIAALEPRPNWIHLGLGPTVLPHEPPHVSQPMAGPVHRLGDMRRLMRQYSRTEAQVYPVGAWFKGGNFGDAIQMPVPFDEQNNPNFVTCTNRSP